MSKDVLMDSKLCLNCGKEMQIRTNNQEVSEGRQAQR
jgi:hypothetical protein